MSNYIDGFVFPIQRKLLDRYGAVAEKVADIWKEHGAISYSEYLGDDLTLEGTRSFTEVLKLADDEVAVFGWILFPSKETRDKANENVPRDPKMEKLVEPLMNPEKPIFDARRMIYGGFKPLVNK